MKWFVPSPSVASVRVLSQPWLFKHPSFHLPLTLASTIPATHASKVNGHYHDLNLLFRSTNLLAVKTSSIRRGFFTYNRLCRSPVGSVAAMRYMNWDVLLFPEGSKTPIQEFKTNCYITQDPGTFPCFNCFRILNYLALTINPDPTSHHNVIPYGLPGNYSALPRYLPTVASFIPNMPLGSPLKVSVHSWEPPVVSPDTQASASDGDKIYFEARVLVDGLCIAGVLFDQQPPWPQVIDTCSHPNQDGIGMPLTFPAFHPEMLTQDHWNAGENFGRIKVLIAEGIAHGQGSAFHRTRSIVCFAFQHAPLRILEDSCIAYPNAGMLYQLQSQILGPPSPRKVQAPDPDAHGHSPRQNVNPETIQTRVAAGHTLTYQDYLAASARPRGPQIGDPYWSARPPAYDIFMDDARYHALMRWGAPSSSGDQSMPDYSHSLTPASSRTHSDHHNQLHAGRNTDTTTHVTTAFDQVDISPNRPASTGTIAPANTRASSAANTPPTHSKPSAAAEARVSSYSHNQGRSVSMTTRDPQQPPPAVREPSDVSMQSRLSENQPVGSEQRDFKIKKKPAKDVKGRKEGQADELGVGTQGQKKLSVELVEGRNKENANGTAEKPILLSDSKRKRSTKSLFLADRALSGINPDSSPSRKVSRVENTDLDDLTPEGVVARTPLADMGNVI